MFGGSFQSVSGQSEITSILEDQGPWARGIVFGSRGANQIGHVWNAASQGGIVRFPDFQSGVAATFNGYKRAAAGFEVTEAVVDYADELDIEQIVGGLYSALRADQLPERAQRPRLAEEIRTALAPHAPFCEQIRVAIVIGRRA
jgi:hypothetical protein